MFKNPFTPIFGGKPGVFFGRSDILKRFEQAMIDPGSDDRAMFLTGTRGSGKTALLEQLSVRAVKKKRSVIDLGPEDTIAQLIYGLTGYDEWTKTKSPQINVNILGSGGGISTGAVSKTRHPGRESLQAVVLEACKKAENGLLVTVDEIQKVPIEDVSSLCNAFQMASRKGHDIMLAVAGLPYAHGEIIRHEGCTYLRRAAHEELGLFPWEETDTALTGVFHGIKGLKIGQDFVNRLNQCSFGHPYLMQLLGYYLIMQINEEQPGKSHEVTKDEVDTTIENALLAYEQRALKPLVEELSAGDRNYLIHMSESLEDDRLARTSEIAKKAGSALSKMSKNRSRLIGHGIIAAPEHGKVMFCIPYLADYVKKDSGVSGNIEVARKRGV